MNAVLNIICIVALIITGTFIFKLLSYLKHNVILEYNGRVNFKIGRIEKLKTDQSRSLKTK